MPDFKFDPERMWLRTPVLGGIIAATAASVLLYARFEARMQHIEDALAAYAKVRSEDRAAVVGSINEVRDELRLMRLDTVTTRQWQTWVDFARTMNKDHTVTWPDLPK